MYDTIIHQCNVSASCIHSTITLLYNMELVCPKFTFITLEFKPNRLKVIYHPLYGMNNYVLIWGDWLSCDPLRGSHDSQSPHIKKH